jgi:hypothetical protein
LSAAKPVFRSAGESETVSQRLNPYGLAIAWLSKPLVHSRPKALIFRRA